MRKFLSALLVAALVAIVWAPATVRAETGWCADIIPNNYHSGSLLSAQTAHFDDIRADIDVALAAGAFAICCFTPTDFDQNGTMAWVSVEAGNTNPQYGNLDAILQIGIIRCADLGVAACKGNSAAPRYFWAYGGCNGAFPNPRDLGQADYWNHKYQVIQSGSTWYLTIDGITKASILNSHSSIACWSSGDLNAGIFAEKWDRGDSFGNSSPGEDKLRFRNIQYSYTSGGLQSPNYTVGGQCPFNEQDHCVFATTNGFNAWTTRP